jgi:hypothetical protein
MWIVALAWIYVVLLMAATETSMMAGIMTFFGYCVLPLSIVFYITGSNRRRARKAASASAATPGTSSGTPAAHRAGRDGNRPAANGSGGNSGSGGDGDAGGDGD